MFVQKMEQKFSRIYFSAINCSELEHRFVIALEDRLYAERDFPIVDVKDMANDLDISIDLAKEALGSLCK